MRFDSKQIAKVLIGMLAILIFAGALVPRHLSAQVLFYEEVEKDGRIYVFNTPERLAMWKASGDMGQAITLVGRGPNGETIVGENETAIDLYNFKHNLPGYERPTAPPPPPPAPYPQVKVGGTGYLSYQSGTTKGVDYNKFTVKRGYINVNAAISSYFSARFTPDLTQDDTGDYKVRMKYVYGLFQAPKAGFLTKPAVEFGMVHTAWLDFEEKINPYRMQDTMFMERVGLFSSADVGFTFTSLLGPEMPDDYQKTVGKNYPGRFGSIALGVYNGGGYAAKENNKNKLMQARFTLRPLPAVLPGFQFSYFGVTGKGNTDKEPDFTLNAIMGSYEHKYVNATAQWFDGKGSANGAAVDAAGKSLNRKGYSLFAEFKPIPKWSGMIRYDFFDPNKNVANDATKRTIVGVAYQFIKGNYLLVDYDRLAFEKDGVDPDTRTQCTLQVNF